jgi:peptide/nickel transport system permease protein
MILKDSLQALAEFWRDFSKEKTGLIGLGFLAAFALLGVFGGLVVPFPDALHHWRDISYWEDNPQAAPPAWVNLFRTKKGVASSILRSPEQTDQKQDDGSIIRTFSFSYDYEYDAPPRDVILEFTGSGQVPMKIDAQRPDGLSAELYADQMDFGGTADRRVSLGRNSAEQVIAFVREQNPDLAGSLSEEFVKPTSILFSKLQSGLGDSPTSLKGTYSFTLTCILADSSNKIVNPRFIVSGDVSGILGTDSSKRDLFTGLVFGVQWALVIGLLTSVLTVLVGMIFGVVAAYFGGVIDWILSRLFEFIYLLPVLPFLIVISAIYKPTIWTFIIIICLFFWSGVYKPVYSMALQIKEETFVEASRALGSGRWRVIFRHIMPVLLPYGFANIALSIPAIIVYEASVSLLGLGDATIITWGQILHDAFIQGAVINNIWWWVIPPGLMIALMGMSFAFLGSALDKILHPKLRTR